MLRIFTFIQKCKEIIHVHQKCGKHHILANSVMALYFFIYANRNKAKPREVTKQVVWIILRNRIFHGTIRHIRSGFPSYARTLCTLTNEVFLTCTTMYVLSNMRKKNILHLKICNFNCHKNSSIFQRLDKIIRAVL